MTILFQHSIKILYDSILRHECTSIGGKDATQFHPHLNQRGNLGMYGHFPYRVCMYFAMTIVWNIAYHSLRYWSFQCSQKYIHSKSGVATKSQPTGTCSITFMSSPLRSRKNTTPQSEEKISIPSPKNSFEPPMKEFRYYFCTCDKQSVFSHANIIFKHKGHNRIPWIVLHQLWNQLWCLVDMCKNNLNACSVLM